MKNIINKFLLIGLVSWTAFSCQDLTELNVDPNNAADVPSNMLFSGAQKKMVDYVYDLWFSGRQCLVYSQYWVQRNYTEEDRYQIRESVNNNYFNALYTTLTTLDRVIELNTDEETAVVSASYGANNNQIAAAKIMKAWLYIVMTNTWGAIPYSEANKLVEGIYYPKYDDQQDIYAALRQELKEASDMIDESEPAFTTGDMIYGGDASKWKKFANSLRMRLGIHVSKVDPNWKQYISEALADGVFESNDDVAAYHYSAAAPNECYFYINTYIDARNDFTISRAFVNILKGQPDTLNNKTHPWEGVLDPRLIIFAGAGITNPNTNFGQPYGLPTSLSSAFRSTAPNWYNIPPCHLAPDFAIPLMTYAEVEFIKSEYNGFSQAEYEAGVEASIDYWSGTSGEAVDAADYLAAISAAGVDAEKLAIQKYIDLYINGTEGWTEIRRTSYPSQLISPGDITAIRSDEGHSGEIVKFEPLEDTKGLIISRVKYPTSESTLNSNNFKAAVAKLNDGTNNYYTKMFWDVRTSADSHPENK